MTEKIEHKGTVETIDGCHVVVRVLQASACSSCAAAQLCRSSETKEKLIDIYSNQARDMNVGDIVSVSGNTGQSLYAVFFAYIGPLFLIVVTIAVVNYFTGNDGISALVALAVLFPYFTVLYFLRDRFSKKLSFNITKITKTNV